MDKKTRHYIELSIENLFLKGDLANAIEWIRQETSISSFRDIVLGYMIGGATAVANTYIVLTEKRAISDKDKTEVRELLRKKLPDFLERVQREMNSAR